MNRLRKFVVNSGSSNNQIRVNITTLVNSESIREATDPNGRSCWVINSATLPDDVVMNDIMYPAAEIEKSFNTLEGTPAPLGHPVVRGEYVLASHPEAYPFLTGAINRNVKRENGRVWVEKWIDKEFAGRNHKDLVDAIENKKPIHTSTGLVLTTVSAGNDKPYKYVATDMVFDHDAILLNEIGAATPEQGVGMFVNSKGVKVKVINSTLNSELWDALQAALPEEHWLQDFTDEVVYFSHSDDSFEQKYILDNDGVAHLTGEKYTVKRVSLWERITNALKPKQENKTIGVNKMDEETKEALEAVAASVATLTEKVDSLAEDVADLKAGKDAEEEERKEVIEANEKRQREVVAKKLGDVIANALTGVALQEAFDKCKAPSLAANLNTGLPVTPNGQDAFAAPDPAEYFGSAK